MAVVERFKQELMYGLSVVAIVERWPLVEVQLYLFWLRERKGVFKTSPSTTV